MKFTDLFIQRPVLAVVVNLLILLVGARSLMGLSVAQFPQVNDAQISVITSYPGAQASLVKGFVTTPLEQVIAEADGIDYLSSTSVRGLSMISAYVLAGHDYNNVLAQVTNKIDTVRNDLPPAAELPVVDLVVGQTVAVFYAEFRSDVLTLSQVTDWALRVAKPRFSSIPGVQSVDLLGARIFAMRVWLDPARMAALRVTASDVHDALSRNNYLAAAGSTRGRSESFSVSTNTSLTSVEEFEQLVVREVGDTQIRLVDVADVALGAQSYDTRVRSNGKDAIYVSLETAPDANLITTLAAVREALAELEQDLPAGITSEINRDASEYVRAAIGEVVITLIEALIIVIAVIFLFLGSVRATLIPAVAVPLSLVGVGTLMLAMGYNINLLTLLAMVLAIGLVVDDAIIVVENIHRHIESGLSRREASLKGARELAGPVIAMTVTLLAVYAPIGFVGGVTGSLFQEFAFTLAGAVLISGIVALTLSPLLCAYWLPRRNQEGRLTRWLNRRFDNLRDGYQRLLHWAMNFRALVLAVGATALVSCYFLYERIPTELAPMEDGGVLLYSLEAPPNTSLDQLSRYADRLIEMAMSFPEVSRNFHFDGGANGVTNSGFGGVGLKPFEERERGAPEILPEMQRAAPSIPGLQVGVFALPPLPGGGGGIPVQFVLTTTEPPAALFEATEQLLGAARASGKFVFATSNLKFDKAQLHVEFDRAKAVDLGLDMELLGRELGIYLGDGFVNRFDLAGRGYKVIPQVKRTERLHPQQILSYPIRTDAGQMLPMSAVATLETKVEPRQLLTFQQLNAATIAAIPAPGVTLGQALEQLEALADDILPAGFTYDYAGQSRLFKSEQGSLIWTFFFAIVIIFLVLAAQFESFRDPIIMLVTVPLSIFGALALLAFSAATMNIYSQVGLVTLIGLISKHGILIVQFANQLRAERDIDRREAVELACAIRLRPVLMTTASIVLAVMPLVFATGAGAAARNAIGLVVAGGMTVGTLFTLFVVPAAYTYIAHRRAVPAQVSVSAPANR
jgi:multidrug efflux pump